jgi:hypothetical protein
MQGKNFTDFTLRVRFRIPSRDRLGIDQPEATFARTLGPAVVLKSADKNKTIRECEWLLLQSSGWHSEEIAQAAAEPLMDALRRTLARYNLAADLGRRSPKGGFFRAGLAWLEGLAERPTLNDTHGPMVFATELQPMFARAGPLSGHRVVQGHRWQRTFQLALDCAAPLSDRERTAFDLFSVAHTTQDAVDARFVLLFAAIETLLEDTPRPRAVVDHIDRLIFLTEQSELENSEKKSLLGSLIWLRSHSIRTSGRRLVRARLGDRQYMGMSAEQFFLDCYDLRNRLLHGRQPFPTREEVIKFVGPLDQMLSNLLAGPVLDC